MTSSSSSPSKPVDDDLKLDELVSELHALKKLYGLLQNNSARSTRPNEPTSHVLDEKSSHILKKLLDDATQQALQSQAKIISCTPETPKSQEEPHPNPSNNDLQMEVRETQKRQECLPTVPPENSPEAEISTPVAQPILPQSLCPTLEPTFPKVRQSKDATVHRCRANDSARLDHRLINRPSESRSRRKSSQQYKNGTRRVQSMISGGSERPPSSEKGGELPTLVPLQKRPRVEPADLRSRVSSRTHKSDHEDRELNHQNRASRKQPGAEPNNMRSIERAHGSKYQSSKSIILVGDQVAQIVQKNDQLRETKSRVKSMKHIKPPQLNRSKAKRFSSSSKESVQSISDSSCSTRSIPLTLKKQNRIKTRKKIAPSPPTHASLSKPIVQRSPSCFFSHHSPTTPIVQKNNQSIDTKRRADEPIKPVRPNRPSAWRYSSSPTGSTTRSNSISNWSARPLTPRKQNKVKKTMGRRPPKPTQITPKPQIPQQPVVPLWKPPSCQREKTRLDPKPREVDNQGRFKKLTEKLAIVFHHHHHHHHHLHAGQDQEGGEDVLKDHESSLWKYLKGVLHVRKGSGKVQEKLHRYNLRVMMEWFFRHLWWMRQRRRKKVERRRKKVERRGVAKKVKWWEWFRSKGGVVVGGRRRIRLRLGFNGFHRRAAGGKG